MNSRRLLLFVIVLFGAFYWFSTKQKKSEANHIKNEKGTTPSPVDQKPIVKNKAALPEMKAEPADSDSLSKCYRSLWQELKVDECDTQCFANYIENHDPDLAQLISEKWADKSVSGRRAYSQLGLFYRSLQNAGMKFDPLPSEKVDMDMALAQISQVSSDDPGNGFPLLFTALIYKLRGREKEAAHYLKAASEAPRFDSYVNQLSKRFRMAAADDPRMGLKALTLYSKFPIPDYRRLEDLIGVNDQAFATILNRMTTKAIETGGKGFSLNWEPIEHQTAIFLLKKIAPNEAEKIPNYREILDRDQGLGTGSHWQFDESKCNKEEFAEELQREKIFLQGLD